MEIIRQSRPLISSKFTFKYSVYMMSPSGDILRLGGWENFWKARNAYLDQVKADKDTKYFLVGSECDPSHFRAN